MSYEGYVEFLCAAGHSGSYDCYADPPATCQVLCSGKECGKELVWWNSVDQTNGDGEEFVAKLEVLEEMKTETCSHCHHTQILEPPRYKVPEDCGHKKSPRGWYDDGEVQGS